jgi:tetratricopeptide (TPR) repeat protein
VQKTKVVFFLFIFLAACSQTPASTQVPLSTPAPTEPAQTETPISQGSIDALEQQWREQAAQQPEDPEAIYQLGLVLAITSPDEAGDILDQLEAISRDYTQPINRLRAALRRGLSINDRAYQLTQVGQALASIEEWQLAEAALQTAVEEDAEYAEAWAYLGEVLYHTNQDGYEALETAVRLNPDSYAANIFMGLYWRRSSQPERALPYLEKAASTDPNNLSLLEDLANTMIQAGQIEEAFETLNEFVEAAPEDSLAWTVLARVSIENDLQVEEVGIPAARQAVMLAPDEIEPQLLLGRAYLLLGNTQLAERFFSQANLTAPNLPEPHYYLGLLYYNLYEFESAQSHLQAAIRLAAEDGNTEFQNLAEMLLDKISP